MRDAATQTAQGITTLVVGVDGHGTLPIGEFLARLDAVPAGSQCGDHGRARQRPREGDGRDFKRPARPDEIAAMRELVARGMEEGAFGLSSGLEYDPGYYSTTDELVALAEVAARRGGFYATHIRNEADETMRRAGRGDGDRVAGAHPRPHLAHQDGHGRGVGPHGRGPPSPAPRPPARTT
jgi:N-acyl-D-amino-acid deacylase